MTSVCISSCLDDVRDLRVPVRATYVNLYKWPESDTEFLRSVSSNSSNGSQRMHAHPRVVDSLSCRQIYLRSYKFSGKESVPEKTQKCFGSIEEKVNRNQGKKTEIRHRKNECLVWKKAKERSCSVLFRIFRRFLSCTASVDVVDRMD